MIKLLMLTFFAAWFFSGNIASISSKISECIEKIYSTVQIAREKNRLAPPSISELREMLQKESPTLQPFLIEKTIAALSCATSSQIDHNQILAVIDYSLPSSEKRLWVFDISQYKKLFHTYVSHGITSGTLSTHFFSNRFNSKASSIGLYRTEGVYYGRDGLSLRLQGLEPGFNDNATNRYIVMHGGWYVEENFIQKYGRAGRSWGCPALPVQETKAVINTIKDRTLLLAYYPDGGWVLKSRFLNCMNNPSEESLILPSIIASFSKAEPMKRDTILFADLNRNGQHEEQEPVITIRAENYQTVFQKKPPLTRMLRRQINAEEYIVLNQKEIGTLMNHINQVPNKDETLASIHFVIPVIVEKRGYYETQMQPLPYGKLTKISENAGIYTIELENHGPIQLKDANHFIRWIGL